MWPQRTTHAKASHRSDVQYVLVANLYKQLQRNYIADYSYAESGQFYQGEQEMIRKAKGKWRRFFCANNAYRWISLYGESFGLPLFWLVLTLLVFPVYLLFNGFSVGADSARIRYELFWSGDFLFPISDYLTAFGKNILFVSFQRGDLSDCLSGVWPQVFVTAETIWIVALVTFFVLALRRRFRRKSF